MVMYKQQIPPPFFESIELNTSGDLENTADVSIALRFDNKEAKDNFLKSSIRDKLRVSIVRFSHPAMKQKYIDNDRFDKDLAAAARNYGRFLNTDLNSAEVKICTTERYFPGQDPNTVIIRESFPIDKESRDLDFAAVAYYDFGLEESEVYTKNLILRNSSIVKERVINKGTRVEEAVVYTIQEETGSPVDARSIESSEGICVWKGEVHYHSPENPAPDGYVGWMAGPRSRMGPKLNRNTVPNTTVRDYTIFDYLSTIDLSPKERRKIPEYKNAYVSPLCLTRDDIGNCKGWFTINFEELVKDNCYFPRLITKQTLGLSRITNIEINRTSRTNAKKKLIVSSEQVDDFVLVANNTTSFMEIDRVTEEYTKEVITGYITELTGKLHIPDNSAQHNLSQRTFAMTDYSMQEEKEGIHTYDLEISFKDGTITWLGQIIRKLEGGVVNLLQYYNDLEDVLNRGQKINFRQQPYTISNKGPWQYSIETVVELLSAFSTIETERIQEQLYLLICPQTGTLVGVEKMLDFLRKTISMLKSSLFGIIKDSATIAGKARLLKSNRTASGNRPPSAIIINHVFAETFDATNNGDIGYVYLNTTLSGVDSPGLSTLSMNNYISLADRETLKYFPIETVQSNAVSAGNSQDDLSFTKLSFLTPNSIKLPGATFEVATHVNNKSVNLLNPGDYLNVLMDVLSYKENGTFATSKVQLSERTSTSGFQRLSSGTKTADRAADDTDTVLEDRANCIPETNQELLLLGAHTKYALSHTLSFLGIQVTEDHESEFHKISSGTRILQTDVLSPSDSEVSNSNDELETEDDTKISNLFTNSVDASKILFPLMTSHLNLQDSSLMMCRLINIKDTAKRKFLPNQYKAIYLADAGIRTNNNWTDGIENINNLSFFYLMNKNLTTVEVFRGFRSGFVSLPIWERLTQSHMNDAMNNNKQYILCRLRRGYSGMPGIIKDDTILNYIPIQDECFLIDVSKKSVATTTNRPQIATRSQLDRLEKNPLLRVQTALIRTEEKNIDRNVVAPNRNVVAPNRGGNY